VSIDEGTVVVERPFTVTNSLPERVVIVKIATTCGCLKADVKKRELEPGEATTLTMSMEVAHTGVIEQTATVVFEDGSTQAFAIRVIGTRSSQIITIPQRLRLVAPNTGVDVALYILDRLGTGEHAAPTVTLAGKAVPTTFSGWTTLEAAGSGRPLRQMTRLHVDVGKDSATSPLELVITTATGLRANVFVHRSAVSD
jgi:hypothetical protein